MGVETQVRDYLISAAEKKASDIYISAHRKILFKIKGTFLPQSDNAVTSEEAKIIIATLYEMAGRSVERYEKTLDDDFSMCIDGSGRFRINVCRQRGEATAVIRVVPFEIPDYEDLRIPDEVIGVAYEKSGLVLVTGPAGSGKTTTLACILGCVNKSRNCHIITLEDPIEYLHTDIKSIFTQREIGGDTESCVAALRACLRQAPDIILLGEMRDLETISMAMTAAETGHLVISTLHTSGAVNTLDRIIDVFPPAQQQQIRVQLAMVLKNVISQRLLPGVSGGLVPVFEIMNSNSAISTLIREGKTHQINNIIKTSASEGMVSMDAAMLKLFKDGHITEKTVIDHAVNIEQMYAQIKAR